MRFIVVVVAVMNCSWGVVSASDSWREWSRAACGDYKGDRREREKMPIGKYYCDYCDKQFQDTPAARRRHLLGLQHLRAKAQWFHSLNGPDLYQTSSQPFSKGVCNRFLKTGFCQYGDNCKYFHPNNDSRNPNPQPAPGGAEGTGNGMTMSWGNLPPSLQPPPEAGYPSLPFVDWG